MPAATVLHQPVGPVASTLTLTTPLSKSKLVSLTSSSPKPRKTLRNFSYRSIKFKVPAAKKQNSELDNQNRIPENENSSLRARKDMENGFDIGWLPAFPHVSIASMATFIFGYHIGVMNGPIVSVARELGFEGDPILEGLVVSIFIAGAFIGSISSGSIVDKLGCRRTFQIDAIPLILGAIIR